MTNSESGIGYSVKDLSEADLLKLLPADIQTLKAEDVFDEIVYSYASFTITDVKITDYEDSEYWSYKVDDGELIQGWSQNNTYKISFTATCDTGGLQLFPNKVAFEDVVKKVGISNETQVGAVFKVSATVKNVDSSRVDDNYVQGADNWFVKDGEWKQYELRSIDADVTYKYTSDGEKEIEFEFKEGLEGTSHQSYTYDLCGAKASEVNASTSLAYDREFKSFYENDWTRVKYDGDTKGPDTYLLDPNALPFIDNEFIKSPQFLPGDTSAPAFAFYGADPTTCLFQGASVDESLRSNDAMKAFLEDHGTIVTDFSDADSGVKDTYKDMLNLDKIGKILLFIGIGILVVIILVVILIIVLVRRAKRKN